MKIGDKVIIVSGKIWETVPYELRNGYSATIISTQPAIGAGYDCEIRIDISPVEEHFWHMKDLRLKSPQMMLQFSEAI